MTDDDIAELERLQATARLLEPDIDDGQWTGKLYVGEGHAVPMYDDGPAVVPLIRWMAAAANAAPALIAEVRRLRAAERLAEALIRYEDGLHADDDGHGERVADLEAAEAHYRKAKG